LLCIIYMREKRRIILIKVFVKRIMLGLLVVAAVVMTAVLFEYKDKLYTEISQTLSADSADEITEEIGIQEDPEAYIIDENDLISDEQEAVLQQYAYRYAQTLAFLEIQDISDLYSDKESEAYYLNKIALDVIVTVRKMASKDMTLEECTVTYNVADAYSYGGKTYISILEDNTQKFRFLDVLTQNFIIQHEFVLEQQDNNWYIKSHAHEEDFYLLAEEAWEQFRGTAEEKAAKVMDAIIADTEENIVWAKENYLNKTEEKTAAYTNYDREAAVEYAKEWVGERNYTGVYLAYDPFGGNCQNFASQCLHAGGLAMDYNGYNQWKFYSKTLNGYATPSGRSYSWTGVEPFFDYCYHNTSGGIVAHTDWGVAFTQKGDVIQVGAMGQWRHSVFVIDVIYDENGYAEEIILASNTADRINYPLSAYKYTAPRLIHIVGKN